MRWLLLGVTAINLAAWLVAGMVWLYHMAP